MNEMFFLRKFIDWLFGFFCSRRGILRGVRFRGRSFRVYYSGSVFGRRREGFWIGISFCLIGRGFSLIWGGFSLRG